MAHALRSAFLALGLILGALFAASPLIAAYRLHESIIKGDISAIEAAVDWRAVRFTLKSSISKVMIADAEARRSEMGVLRRVGYRIGDAFAPYLVDRILAKQVTPAGFIAYMREPLPAGVRQGGMLQNIERAAYTGLSSFEIDVRDRLDRSRRYRAVFTRAGFSWILAEVHVLPAQSQATLRAAASTP
ncbi:MAG: DUF2939 domain-containing protein [Hyphomicrobiaceae bacterium]